MGQKSSVPLQELLYTALCDLGLSEQEIDLYVLSLTTGPSAIAPIAERVGVSRPNVYKIIASLEQKGLTDFSTRTKKYARSFSVAPPSRVLELLREHNDTRRKTERSLVAELPNLLSTYLQGEGVPRVSMYRGHEEYRKAFRMVTEESDAPILFCGSITDFVSSAGSEFRTLTRERVRKNIPVHALLLPGPDTTALERRGEEELRTVRVLKTTQPFTSSFQLFAHKILIWQPVAPVAIVLEDQYITDMFRSLFHTLWEQAES